MKLLILLITIALSYHQTFLGGYRPITLEEYQQSQVLQDLLAFGQKEFIDQVSQTNSLITTDLKLSNIESIYEQVVAGINVMYTIGLSGPEGNKLNVTFVVFYQPWSDTMELTSYTINPQSNKNATETSKKVLLIRHAQSNYNSAIAKTREMVGNLDEEDALREIAKVKFSPDLIDTGISEKGVNQAKEAALLVKDQNVKIVLTSPLRRCLQTTELIFRDHPNKPKIIVAPLLKEISSSSCDIGDDIHQIKKEFPHFDFTLVEQMPVPELWYIDILTNEDQKKEILDEIYQLYPEDEDAFKYAKEILAAKMLERFPGEYESLVDLNQRVGKAKTWAKEVTKDLKDDELVAMVTHSKFLQSFYSKEYGINGEFIGSRRFNNCEVFEHNL